MIDVKLRPSFGRRKARKLRLQSQQAYDEILPLVRLAPEHAPFDDKVSEVWLEIGFGGGEHFIEQLQLNPSVSMIGCEPFMNGVAKFLMQLKPEDYGRVRVWHEDVRHLLGVIPASYFSCVFILFPDPWPKKRHHVRRLITKEFMTLLWPTLKEGAFLHVASDDQLYVEQIQEVLYGFPGLVLCEGPSFSDPQTWLPRPLGWPATRYEQKAIKQGKKCAYMRFQKRGRGSSE
ncbi:MAG: tRNA (guanosine(46)-N7)-methyltransferase TrmB [Alphaproteobacteria bacterium]|nr:tRNA (guanosine(46)-N7)-methyltransferase TrmB [Alphaproteobacteria bacterium]